MYANFVVKKAPNAYGKNQNALISEGILLKEML